MDETDSRDQQMQRIGNAYWHNTTIATPTYNPEKLAFHSSESRLGLSKKRRFKQIKSDIECFASFTFGSFNRELIYSYESRNPQPKEWKTKS